MRAIEVAFAAAEANDDDKETAINTRPPEKKKIESSFIYFKTHTDFFRKIFFVNFYKIKRAKGNLFI